MKVQNQSLKNSLKVEVFSDSSCLSPQIEQEIETWVVNSVKVRMIRKLDNLLEVEGRVNARKLFLVPVFTISELAERVKEQAPEIKTFFYKELIAIMDEAEKKISD